MLIEEHLHLPEWVRHIQASALEKSLSQQHNPALISFALGLPSPDLFPRDLCQRIVEDVVANERLAFQYHPTTDELKSHIVKLMRLRGVTDCHENQILLTSGAQQGINLLIRMLLEPGDSVILEELVYPGALQSMRDYSPSIFTVGTDPLTGIDVEAVEAILKANKKIRLLYVVTEGGNPHGVSIEKEKRIYLAQLAQKYGVPIIEDDPYGFITYENAPPPIKHYGGDWVFYVGSFSKIFAPSFRVGWLVVPESLIPKLASLKECSDINTMTFTQHIINEFLNQNAFEQQLSVVTNTYKKRRDCMLQALTTTLPSDASFYTPSAGIFIWVDFPRHVNTTVMLDTALSHANVAFIPSASFGATSSVLIQNGMRLNFSHSNEATIALGMERLKPIFQQLI